ncbi:hypothetical protein V8G54_032139 [Vigna mungo]|uniref:Transcription factor CBF/NF-Y/archaeal histone domain-containing protein n=1 Tax=Vigna mungo TaxID=3915 RepID=A0AAQ3MLE7_VIGMU
MDQNQQGEAGKRIGADEGKKQTADVVPVASPYAGGYRYDRQCIYQRKQEQLQQRVKTFWERQMKEIKESSDLKSHSLPLSRIKKIMKFDEDVKMVSSEATMLLGKACELFIMELTMRSWAHVEDDKRKIIKKTDVASAISMNDMFDFLVDVVPRDDTVPVMAGQQVLPPPNQNAPYPYMSLPPPPPPPPPYAAPTTAPGNASSSSAANPSYFNFNPTPDEQDPSNFNDH